MKRNEPDFENILKQSFECTTTPPRQQVELAWESVLRRRQENPELEAVTPLRGKSHWRWARPAFALAAIVLTVSVSMILVRNWSPMKPGQAMVTDGSVFRASEREAEVLHSGQRIESGEIVQAAGAKGAMLTLADGSRVEMRSQTNLSLERADDGVRIRLNKGDVIVNAAKQRAGHLYVQTKDIDVSVVGTVFLINAEESGSRVAVIEGEVRVQQGTTEKRLRPGDHLATNPVMESQPVSVEITWSRHAEEHLALLQRSAVPAASSAKQSEESLVRFEVASVRLGADPAVAIGRGGSMPFGFGCGGALRLDPRHFIIVTNVFTLVAMANGQNCFPTAKFGRISGGPKWITSDQFTIEAVMPEGTPAYTQRELLDGTAVKLQMMIQTLLMERFKLAAHRDTKEVPVYALTVAKNGAKLGAFHCDSTPLVRPQQPPCMRGGYTSPDWHFIVNANAATVEMFAQVLTASMDRPVIDRTGIAGVFDFHLESSLEDTASSRALQSPYFVPPTDNPPSIFDAIQQQLGLKLDPVKAQVETIIIDHVEQPAPN